MQVLKHNMYCLMSNPEANAQLWTYPARKRRAHGGGKRYVNVLSEVSAFAPGISAFAAVFDREDSLHALERAKQQTLTATQHPNFVIDGGAYSLSHRRLHATLSMCETQRLLPARLVYCNSPVVPPSLCRRRRFTVG
jgi:hypothetical protein